MGAIEWAESAEELRQRYRAEGTLVARKRLQALWPVRRGESVTAAAEAVGVGRRTLGRWLGWYRRGGLAEVLERIPGHGARGAQGWLSLAQREELVTRAARGEFRTYEEARVWVEREWGVRYSYKGMYWALAKLGVHPKVPRPAADKADPEAQAAWKGGGSAQPSRRRGSGTVRAGGTPTSCGSASGGRRGGCWRPGG